MHGIIFFFDTVLIALHVFSLLDNNNLKWIQNYSFRGAFKLKTM